MTEYEKTGNLNRKVANDSVDKLFEISSEFEPTDVMPLGLISEALANRKRKKNPLLPLIFVGAAGVVIFSFCLANYRKAPTIALPAKNIESVDNPNEVSAVPDYKADLQYKMLDNLSFDSVVLESQFKSRAKRTFFASSHRHIQKRRRGASIVRLASKLEFGAARAPLKTYSAMWKTETVERNYSGIIATTLVATQDEQDRKDGTFTFTPAIVDLPLNPGDTITTTEETSAVPVSTTNYKEESP